MDDKMNADKLAQAFRAGFLCACKWPSPVAQDVDSPGFQKDFEAWLAAQPALPAQPVGVPEYSEEMGNAANKYHASFKYAHPLPARWSWSDLWKVMTSAAHDAARAAEGDE